MGFLTGEHRHPGLVTCQEKPVSTMLYFGYPLSDGGSEGIVVFSSIALQIWRMEIVIYSAEILGGFDDFLKVRLGAMKKDG